MASISALTSYVPPLVTPVHSDYFPIAPLDVFGAMRLSSVIDWMARGVFENRKDGRRATLLQEIFGMMVVVFGPETFLGMCTGQPPSWLSSLKIPLLFALTHTLQTRTSLRRFLPAKPSLALELPLAIPDAIGRTLLLTQFSIVPILTGDSPLPATPASLLLVPFIFTVPFASLIFTGTNFFTPNPTITTPAELKPWGWTAADAWAPVLIPVMFLTLVGPVEGWQIGFGWSSDEAIVLCMITLSTIFVGRAIYNFGYKKEQWTGIFSGAGAKSGKGARKIKTN